MSRPISSAPQFQTDLPRQPHWWMFCLAVFTLKYLLLALDPLPKFFMGDSGSYLWTALSGWIPPDRSFLYGYVVRWTSLSTGSLTSLLLLQTFLSTATAVVVALICRKLYCLGPRLSYFFGCLCAIDPLQLVWERYVMTEAISLFLYAAMLFFALSYLKNRRFRQLAAIQVLGVLVISFRISYLLVVQATTLILPLVAFLPLLYTAPRTRWFDRFRSPIARSVGVHTVFAVGLMFALHLGYQHLNGFLAKRQPAYLYSSGFSILASWAPVLLPSDAPNPRLAQIIQAGNLFHLTDMRLRNSQLYSKGYLVDRWQSAEPDFAVADRIAKKTALNALLRRPLGVFGLGLRTFFSYFDWQRTHRQAKSDLGKADWPEKTTATMASRFRLAPPPHGSTKSYSILQRYFLRTQPYYYLVLLSPLAGAVLLFIIRARDAVLLFVHACIFLTTGCLLAVTASVRYLQPLSFVTILIIALLVKHLRDRRALRPLSAIA
jgi:hypothetical protein